MVMEKEKRKSNTNLFQQDAAEQPQEGAPGEKKQQSPGMQVNASSSSGGGSAPKGEVTRPKQQYSQSGAYRAAVEANTGRAEIPGVVGKIGESLKKRQEELQKRADEYTSAQKEAANKEYGHSQEDIDKAARGDKDAEARLGNVLHPGAPRPAPEFKTGEYRKPEDLLSGPEGIRKELSRGRGITYTPGESNFDLYTLSRSEKFPQKIRELLSQQDVLKSKATELAESRRKESDEYIKNKISEQKGMTEQELQKYANDLRESEEKNLADWNRENDEAYQQYEKDLPGFKNQELANLKYELYYELNKGGSELSPHIINMIEEELRNDPQGLSNFLTELKREKKQGISNAYTKDESERYNRIYGLLGKNERVEEGYDTSVRPDRSSYVSPYGRKTDEARKKYITTDKIIKSIDNFQRGYPQATYVFNDLRRIGQYGEPDYQSALHNILKNESLSNDIRENLSNQISDYVNRQDRIKIDDFLKKNGHSPAMYGEAEKRTIVSNMLKGNISSNQLANFAINGLKIFRNSTDWKYYDKGEAFRDNLMPINLSIKETEKLNSELRKIPGYEDWTYVPMMSFIKNQSAADEIAKQMGL